MVPRPKELSPDEEQQLVMRAKQGERDACRLVVELFEGRVFATISRMVGDRETARDLCQETFVRALRSLGGFSGRAKLGTWITSIALNVVKTFWSSRTFNERRASDSFDPERHAVAHHGPEWAETEMRLERMRRALEALQPQHRDVIVLCWLEQKGYDEVAEVLGIPYGTVCSRLHAGLKALRAIVKMGEDDET